MIAVHADVHVDQWQALGVEAIKGRHLTDEVCRVEKLLLRNDHFAPVAWLALKDDLGLLVEVFTNNEQLNPALVVCLTEGHFVDFRTAKGLCAQNWI